MVDFVPLPCTFVLTIHLFCADLLWRTWSPAVNVWLFVLCSSVLNHDCLFYEWWILVDLVSSSRTFWFYHLLCCYMYSRGLNVKSPVRCLTRWNYGPSFNIDVLRCMWLLVIILHILASIWYWYWSDLLVYLNYDDDVFRVIKVSKRYSILTQFIGQYLASTEISI